MLENYDLRTPFDGSTVLTPRVVRGKMQSGKEWLSALWLDAMHSGEN